MRLRRIILFMSLLLGPWLVRAQNAQPAIITFDADLLSITVDAAEAGQTNTTLSWHVINVSSSQHLVVEQRSLNTWVSVVPGDETLLPVGSLLLPVQHPLDFGPPTYRLRLLDASDNLLDERIISIPYEIPADSQPSIEVFSSSTATLLGGSDGGLNAEHVNVTWKVIDRVPGSNLVFDQVLENGQSVPVELPRDNLWVVSQGSGDLAPVPPLSSNVI